MVNSRRETQFWVQSDILSQLSDPQDSQYPIDLLPSSQVHTYVTPMTHKYDIPKKLANEVDIMIAPDYENVEEWEKAPLKEPTEEEEG